jgi:hypothetical protein
MLAFEIFGSDKKNYHLQSLSENGVDVTREFKLDTLISFQEKDVVSPSK